MTEKLTKEQFIDKIFNYEESQDWKYKGSVPAIIDFWAEWCGPCKMIAPVLEELSTEYGEKLKIYKVNTEEEQELSQVFSVQSIPALLFIPVDGKPRMSVGALPKNSLKKAIKDLFDID